MRLRILALACLVAIQPARATTQAPTAARTSLIEADQAAGTAIFRRGIQQGLQEFLADDAVLLLEGAPLFSGRARIVQVLGDQAGLGRLKIQRMPVLVFTSSDGNYGATTGANVITRQGQSSDSAATYGHYIAVWQRTAESAPWKIVALLENGLMADARFQKPSGFDPGTVPELSGTARLLADADLAFARMAADSGVGPAFGIYAAPDATFPPGDGIVSLGASAIRARMSTPSRMQSVWLWHPVYGGGTAQGDFGFTVGESTIRSSRASDASVYEGKYLTVWQRQPDGSLKFILDSGNSR
jgi:ketosteroid isomerase-like protein